MIGVTDDAGNILYLNEATRRRLGLADGLRLTTADLFPESTFRTYFEEIRPSVLRHGHWSGYVRALTSGREVIDVWMTVVGEARPGGEIGWLVTSARDITEWRQTRDELSWRATHDELTGLAGRVLLADRLELALARCRRSAGVVAVMFVDFDDLKMVNDALGHHAGDEALVELAHRLTGAVRAVDTVARVSGDEFVVVAEGLADEGEAAALFQRLEAEVATIVVRAGGGAIVSSASIGMALSDGELEGDELLRRADAAMYEAKRQRGQVGTAGTPPPRHDEDRHPVPRITAHEIAAAVSQRLVTARFQPVIAVGGELVGYQALARLGDRRAATFMDQVEGSGVGLSLDLSMLRQAAQHAATWQWEPPPRVYVHLSSRFLVEPDADRYVAEALERAGLAPERLALEVPGQLLARRHSTYVGGIRSLRALGIRLVVAHVGLGSPSIADLAEGLFDEMRLALQLTLEVEHRPAWRRAIRATTALAHTLGLSVTAVGVENPVQRSFVVDAGCDQLEGDLLGEAIPAEALLHR
jgi:diguanylate cyclase (GGDEF)-like protein